MQYVRTLIVCVAFFATPAVAQQPPTPQGTNPEFLQHALNALQAQRNRAQDEAASVEALLSQAQHQIADLQKQVDGLKAKYEPADSDKK
jgi:chromosome segregation ATPase